MLMTVYNSILKCSHIPACQRGHKLRKTIGFLFVPCHSGLCRISAKALFEQRALDVLMSCRAELISCPTEARRLKPRPAGIVKHKVLTLLCDTIVAQCRANLVSDVELQSSFTCAKLDVDPPCFH